MIKDGLNDALDNLDNRRGVRYYVNPPEISEFERNADSHNMSRDQFDSQKPNLRSSLAVELDLQDATIAPTNGKDSSKKST